MVNQKFLEEALKKYGRHILNCPKGWGSNVYPCTCGLSNLIKDIELVIKDEPVRGIQ